jgi:hypothetical protein
MKFKGVIIEESLKDNRILNRLKIISIKISTEENSNERWHLYKVLVSEKEIDELSKNLKQGWYMHFWEGRNVVVIFKNKKFRFNYDNKKEWELAIDYGLSIGIPKEQLDFPIED